MSTHRWTEYSGRLVIVDLKAGELKRTLDFLLDVGVFEAAQDGLLNLTVLHLLGPSVASLAEIAETERYRDKCRYFFVKNLVNNSQFFDQRRTYVENFISEDEEITEIRIPKLDALAFENVELAGLPFSEFVLDETQSKNPLRRSFVLRGYVRTWLDRVWRNFERAGMDGIAG